MTIFEIAHKKNKSKPDTMNAANVMRALKDKNETTIEKFKEEKVLRIEQMRNQTEKIKDDSFIPYRSGSHCKVNEKVKYCWSYGRVL